MEGCTIELSLKHSEVKLLFFGTAVMSRTVAIFELPCEASKEGALIRDSDQSQESNQYSVHFPCLQYDAVICL